MHAEASDGRDDEDVGTGYASVACLQRFPIDCLKIDRRVTNAITSSPESRALLGTLVQLSRDLGLSTVAEGVGTEAEMDHLRRERVNEAEVFCSRSRVFPRFLNVSCWSRYVRQMMGVPRVAGGTR